MSPDVPTTKELGYPKIVAGNVYCIFGPAKMAPTLAIKLTQIFRDGITDGDVVPDTECHGGMPQTRSGPSRNLYRMSKYSWTL